MKILTVKKQTCNIEILKIINNKDVFVVIAYIHRNSYPLSCFDSLKNKYPEIVLKRFSSIATLPDKTNLILFEICFDIRLDSEMLRGIKKYFCNPSIVIISHKIQQDYLLLTIRENILDYICLPLDEGRINMHMNSFLERGTKKRIRDALFFIESNFNKKIYNKNLAEISNMSRASFLRHFKKEMRVTPQKYISQFRIDKSQELLMKSNLSISEVGYDVGFDDTSYFIKMFKCSTGQTPASFRSQCHSDISFILEDKPGNISRLKPRIPELRFL